MDHGGDGDNFALLAPAATLCHGEGIGPFRSEVPQLVGPTLRVHRAVPLQSFTRESCRDHPAAADTAVDGVVFPQASSWLVTTIVVLRHWGQAVAR